MQAHCCNSGLSDASSFNNFLKCAVIPLSASGIYSYGPSGASEQAIKKIDHLTGTGVKANDLAINQSIT